jgi:5'-nucleotidase
MKKWHFFRPGIVLLCLLVSGWTQPAPAYAEGKELLIKILALNDFHGHISKDGLHDKKASAPVLAAHLEAAAQGWEGRTFLVHAGDQIGASPAASALLKEEPSVIFLNILADRPGWSIIGTLGNHEFDQGKGALLRLIRRNHEGSRSLVKPYCGANFPYVCANVAHEGSDQPLLPPFVTRTVEGIPIAFIGAVTTETPQKVIKSKLSGLRFRDEANAINEQVALRDGKSEALSCFSMRED